MHSVHISNQMDAAAFMDHICIFISLKIESIYAVTVMLFCRFLDCGGLVTVAGSMALTTFMAIGQGPILCTASICSYFLFIIIIITIFPLAIIPCQFGDSNSISMDSRSDTIAALNA